MTYFVCFPGHPTLVSEIGPYYDPAAAMAAATAMTARRGIETAVRIRHPHTHRTARCAACA